MSKREKKSNAETTDYEAAFHELMKRKMRDGLSIEDRIRHLVFAIVDSSCPLHEYASRTPSVQKVSYLIGEIEEGDRQSSPVRDAMFKLSGRLGILNQTSDQVKLRIAMPQPHEVAAINELRFDMERLALIRLHRMEDKGRKNAIIESLTLANYEMDAVSKLSESYRAKGEELSQKFTSDPGVGDWADRFWKRDIRFHCFPSLETASSVGADLLQILLERMRISASDRQKIVERIPTSVAEHARIIETVAKTPAANSEQDIDLALRDHLRSSNEYFGLDIGGGGKGPAPSVPR